jgi:hypothetical protein
MSRNSLLLALLVLAGGPSAVSIAEETPPGKAVEQSFANDEAAAQYLKDLEPKIQKQEPAEAVASVKRLVAYWKDQAVKPETKKPIPGLVAWYARRKVQEVALAGVDGLSEIGRGEGTKSLVALLEPLLPKDDSKPDEVAGAVADAVFAALKKVADPDPAVTDPIVKLFVHPSNAVVGKAADVFGGYRAAKATVRRELFEEVLKSFEGVASQAQAPPSSVANKSATNKWSAIGDAVMRAVNALSHQQFESMAAARAWFNDHKKDLESWS